MASRSGRARISSPLWSRAREEGRVRPRPRGARRRGASTHRLRRAFGHGPHPLARARGFRLAESSAIAEYLEEVLPPPQCPRILPRPSRPGAGPTNHGLATLRPHGATRRAVDHDDVLLPIESEAALSRRRSATSSGSCASPSSSCPERRSALRGMEPRGLRVRILDTPTDPLRRSGSREDRRVCARPVVPALRARVRRARASGSGARDLLGASAERRAPKRRESARATEPTAPRRGRRTTRRWWAPRTPRAPRSPCAGTAASRGTAGTRS